VEADATGGGRRKRSLDYARDDRMSKRARRSEGLARRCRGGERNGIIVVRAVTRIGRQGDGGLLDQSKDEEGFHREKTRDGEAVLSSRTDKE
jgi:hypothetical protein